MMKPSFKSNPGNQGIISNIGKGSRKSDQVLKNLRIFSSIITHVVAVAFPAYIIYLAVPDSSLFSWHPMLMAVAFFSLMVEAILVFNVEGTLFFKASRKTKVTLHWILQTSSVTCATAGFMVILLNKYNLHKSHFTTWHGLVGVIAVTYCIIQALSGIFPLYPSFAKNWKLVQLKTYHATFGLVAFTLACLTIALSLYSNWFTKNVKGFLWGLSLFCPVWLAFVIMNQVTSAYLPKARRHAPLY